MRPGDRAVKIVFFCSLLFLVILSVFSFGFFVGWERTRLWPYRVIEVLGRYPVTFYETGEWAPARMFVRAPIGAPRERIVIRKPALVQPGYRAVLGWNGDQDIIWLFDERGEQLYSWPIDIAQLDLRTHADFPTGSPHGFMLLPDGSVLIAFTLGNLLTRIDPCGEPIWQKRGAYHHLISRADNGSFWVWLGDDKPNSAAQLLVNFSSEDGSIIQTLSLTDDFINHTSANSLIFTISDDAAFEPEAHGDIFHPNDVEELTSALSPAFSKFRTGDLLISLRHLNLVAVLDPVHKVVKWWSHGPWRFQHDPDFLPDGTISVYNNNNDIGPSNILRIDPSDSTVGISHSSNIIKAYSESRGVHQLLSNGTLLIVVPDEGRMLELNKSEEVVLEYNNVWSDRANGNVQNGLFVSKDFFDEFPDCKTSS